MRTLLLWLAVVALCITVYALWTWRNAENVVGATSAEVQGTLKELRGVIKTVNEKLDAIDTPEVNQRVKDLGMSQAELDRLLVSVRKQSEWVTMAATARINQLGDNLTSLKAVTDETRAQIKQNGDEAAKTLASLNRTITDVDTRFSKILEDGSLMLETANPKLQELLTRADAVMIDTDGTIKSFQPITTNLAGITADFNAMTMDSRNKLHSILFPEPVKGFWPNVKRVATFLLTPAMEGARIYFQLHALPVKITQPVPILKAP